MKEAPVTISIPRWYQDLSIPQMQNVFSLADIIRADYAERITARTQRALGDMGVTSTFVKITPEQIKQLRRLANLDPVKFLCEIYRIVTGKYFTDEEYKKSYDCNERIILSAIAFLTLPKAVIELHRRLPMGVTPKFPSKPVPHPIGPRRRLKSPYLEPLFTRPDWLTYKKELHLWRKKCENIPVPRVILPSFAPYTEANGPTSSIAQSDEVFTRSDEKQASYRRETTDKNELYERENEIIDKTHDGGGELLKDKAESSQQHELNSSKRDVKIGDNIRARKRASPENSKSERKSSKSISQGKNTVPKKKTIKHKSLVGKAKHEHKPSGKAKPRRSSKSDFHLAKQSREQSKIENACLAVSENRNDPKRADVKKRSNRDEKDTHLIVTGVTENDDLLNFPISRKTSGIAYVTPVNSDEDFFQALNLKTKKTYPRGRENLSRKWQEWFRDVDEEFTRAEKKANEIIKSVETTLKLTGPEPVCDGCCSCRQTRKANDKYHSTKTPRVVIDSITMNGERNKYVIGSLSMNLPAPSPTDSMINLPEVIDSHDKFIKNKIIGGVTNQQGNVNYHINGVIKHVEHVPKKIVETSSLVKTIRNVPPCGCTIEKMINEGLNEITSSDNIPWTKDTQICIGKKYRPREGGTSSCRDYPNDKSCRRNLFKKKIDEQIYGKVRGKENQIDDNDPLGKKNMYSLAAFQPCGDEDGMAVCGGPWGAVNTPDEEELARREAEAKLIRESPPCGDKPGRAICGAPFGARHPIPKQRKKDDEEEEDEEEPEDEEPEVKKKGFRESRKASVGPKKEKHLNRDSRCSTVTSKTERISDLTEHSPRSTSKIQQFRKPKVTRNKTRKSLKDKNEDPRSDEAGNLGSKSQSQMSNLTNTTGVRESRDLSKEGKSQDDARKRSSELVKLKKEWNRSKILASKFVRSPVILPEDPPGKCKRESADEQACCKGKKVLHEDESPKDGPFSWRTISEQALPVEKTLVYLVEPNEPVETIPVRPGGKPCKCRENRNAKKVLLYNVTGITRNEKAKRKENIARVIDGLIYITPTPSVRNSEEYIPEYELYESPYEKCARERKIDEFKYIEKYLGPKSLMKKPPRDPVACECRIVKAKMADSSSVVSGGNQGKSAEKEVENSGGKKWSKACEDEALMEFYTRCRDNVPCWLRCVQFSNDGCCATPRRLRIKKPVCECKYERRFVKREEEKKKWLSLQARLRSHKKQPFTRVEGLSRPMQIETKIVISEVKKTSEEFGDPRYCVDGVKQDLVMAPGECVLSGIGMHTPVKTPEPSKTDLPIAKVHRHWSPMDVAGSRAVSGNSATLQLRQVRTNRRDEVEAKINKNVDVLFRSDRPVQDGAGVKRFDRAASRDTAGKKNFYRESRGGNDEFRNRTENRNAPHGRGKDRARRRDTDDDPYQSGEKNTKPKVVHPGTSMQEFDDYKPMEASPTDYGTYLSEKDWGQEQRTNADPIKSTGSIMPRDNMAVPRGSTKVSEATNLKHLVQIELERMANEGFLFAKLPACHLMPQLQYWIMYRKGIALPPEEKKILMSHSMKIWESVQMPKKIKPPELTLPKKFMKNLTWDKAAEIKRETELKRAVFYSNLRKSRVLLSRTMWGLMEFGKFPGVSFKRAYFTYQASKESSGFCFKPWTNSDQSEDSSSHV